MRPGVTFRLLRCGSVVAIMAFFRLSFSSLQSGREAGSTFGELSSDIYVGRRPLSQKEGPSSQPSHDITGKNSINGAAATDYANQSATTDNPVGPSTTSECIPPAIDQFPDDVFNMSQLRSGAVLLHVVGVVYMFVALAVACDDYFVPSLERICEVFKINPDVAGATFMAAGSSAPELASSVIGVFVAQDDIGLSAVVGSAVFNIMFVIGICGVCAPAAVPLACWPMVRDAVYYALSVLILFIVIYDEQIQLVESIVLLVLYFLYIVVMYFNETIERGFRRLCCCWSCCSCCPESGGCRSDVRRRSLLADEDKVEYHPVDSSDEEEELTESAKIVRNPQHDSGRVTGSEAEESQPMVANGNLTRSVKVNTGSSEPPRFAKKGQESQLLNGSSSTPNSKHASTESPHEDVAPLLTLPRGLSWWRVIIWATMLPLRLPMYLTTPDCRRPRWRNWFMGTFVITCCWIAVFSYLLIWLLTTIGYVAGISDDIMSITFLAAGVSIPDAIASLIVIKQGEGDMAVSNAVGSNVFDILLCLGLPWFLSNVIYQKSVKVYSEGLLYTTLTLFSTVIILLAATHANGWKLDRKYGVCLLVLYAAFMALAVLYQLNVFGEFNPPTCVSQNM